MSDSTSAQNCKTYHAKNCKFNEKDEFQYSGQSRSAAFTIGQSSEFPLLAYGGYDYSVTLCYEKKLGDVQLKVMEEDGRKVIYDNADDSYSKRKIFTVSSTKKLIVQITVVGEKEGERNEKNTGCVGVLIEYMKTPNSGF